MARTFFVNGETMVWVNGNLTGNTPTISQLGLSDRAITITVENRHAPVTVNAWGAEPADIQYMGTSATIQMTLVHLDVPVLEQCIALSQGNAIGGAQAAGIIGRAGRLMGGGIALQSAGGGNRFLRLNLASPIGSLPWRFHAAYLVNQVSIPLGTERSLFGLTWQAIPYAQDPWGGGTGDGTNAGTGLGGYILYDHTLDAGAV